MGAETIVLDLDDVMADTEAAIRSACADRFGDRFHQALKPGVSTQDLDRSFKNFIYNELLSDPGFLFDLKMLPRVRDALKAGHQRGYQMHVVTGRFASPSSLFGTLAWLREMQLVPYLADVHLRPRNTRTPAFKRRLTKRLHAQFAIDDRPETVLALGDVCEYAFVMSRRWNQTARWQKRLEQSERVVRVRSLYEMMQKIP